jgi:hypothetical protein
MPRLDGSLHAGYVGGLIKAVIELRAAERIAQFEIRRPVRIAFTALSAST